VQFNLETFRSEIADLTCPSCSRQGEKRVSIVPDGPHFARIHCLICSAFVDWLAFPKQTVSERRRKRARVLTTQDRCELCLRHELELPGAEKLQEHHVVAWENGGSDDAGNLRVYCPACHGLVEWARTYFGHYHPAVA